MPHQPTAPAGTRFFARLDRFHCECPACGAMIVASKDPRLTPTHLRRTKRRMTTYNPIASVVVCPSCRKSFGVGLLLWPLSRGGRKALVPEDHQPTRRQLRDLSAYSYGIWAAEIKQQGDSLNVAIDAECLCPQDLGGWRPDCPVHGSAEYRARRAAEDAARGERPPEDEE